MRRTIALLSVLLASTACTAGTPVVDPTDTVIPTGTATGPTAKPKPAKQARTAAYLANDAIWIYDVATDRATELATGTGVQQLAFLDADTLSLSQPTGVDTVIRSIDLQTRSTAELDRVEGDVFSYDISSDGAVLAVLALRGDKVVAEIRYLVGDRAVLQMTTIEQVGRGFSVDDQIAIAFSPDDQLVLLVDTAAVAVEDPERSPLQVRRLDGTLAYEIGAGRSPTMATWAPGGALYFRSDDGIRRWKSGDASSSAVADLSAWYHPSVSPNGRFVVYDTGAVTLNVRTRRLNLQTSEVTDVGPRGRFNPVHARTDEVWTQIAQRCEPDCETNIVGGPQVYATNLATGVERRLALPTLERLSLWFA